MSDFRQLITTPQSGQEVEDLYMWRGHGIVLIGEHADGRWVLARGWMVQDTLEHVRRWSFAVPGPFAGQVRRLVAEATGNVDAARSEGTRALAWTARMTTTA
ncbi:MAG: hypothetical protein KC442_13885 [Thermomicrobiales bacterium]|nr:hypothetical protein [Thermomicrobiales bacterium]